MIVYEDESLLDSDAKIVIDIDVGQLKEMDTNTENIKKLSEMMAEKIAKMLSEEAKNLNKSPAP